tara:strand:+ start:1218 stop:1346 length:129 start_codon:yes stop_codon:yes gene_type:complete
LIDISNIDPLNAGRLAITQDDHPIAKDDRASFEQMYLSASMA